jgi:hypothetical protein
LNSQKAAVMKPIPSYARLGGYVRRMDDFESKNFVNVTGRDMRHVKVGDHVLRKFSGSRDFESGATMELIVTEVDDELIYCGPKGIGWSFDRATGAEVDHDLRWGPIYGMTGTFLVGFADGNPSASEAA